MDTTEKTAPAPPLQQPLHPAHPDAAAQPVLVADMLTGNPTWVYPQQPAPPPPPAKVDPWAQRILASGAVSPLIGWGGSMFFNAVAGAETGIGYLALCIVGAAALRAGSGKSGSNVNIRIDNRGR